MATSSHSYLLFVAHLFFHVCRLTASQVDLGQDHLGLSHNKAAWSVSAVGGASALGRVLIGLFGDLFRKRRLPIFVVSLWVNGTMAMLLSATSDFASFMAISTAFGLSAGAFVALSPLLIEEYTTHADIPKV